MDNSILTIQKILVFKYLDKISLIDLSNKEQLEEIKKKNIIPILTYSRIDVILGTEYNVLDLFEEKKIEFSDESLNIIVKEDLVNFFSYVKDVKFFNISEQHKCEYTNKITEIFKNMIKKQKELFEKEKNFKSMEQK